MKNIGVLVSGGGTNLQALIDAIKGGIIKSGRIVTVVSNNSNAYALKRAEKHRIDTSVISKKDYPVAEDFDRAILNHMKSYNVDLIVMAGFLAIVGKTLTDEYKNKIINIHPSLIPSFCGKGYYGLKVHEAAIEYGVKVSGATVHFVNEITDGGAIILQKPVSVLCDDTPETLQDRIMREAEWKILPEAVELFCADRLIIDANKVIIKENVL